MCHQYYRYITFLKICLLFKPDFSKSLFLPFNWKCRTDFEKKKWNSKIVKDKNRCPTNFDTSINFDWNNKKKQNNTKRNKSNTNTYLALTVPIRLSSAERANDGSSTVTSNFGKTERKTFEYSHHRDPNCDWWSNTLLKPFFYLFLKFLIYILKSFFLVSISLKSF